MDKEQINPSNSELISLLKQILTGQQTIIQNQEELKTDVHGLSKDVEHVRLDVADVKTKIYFLDEKHSQLRDRVTLLEAENRHMKDDYAKLEVIEKERHDKLWENVRKIATEKAKEGDRDQEIKLYISLITSLITFIGFIFVSIKDKILDK